MSDVLARVARACNPMEPATAEQYYICDEARGDSALTKDFQRRIARAGTSTSYRRLLFSGHSGCGKSSELQNLQRALNKATSPYPRYVPVVVDASDYLDYYDVEVTDILLAIVVELASTLRDEYGIELKDSYFDRRLSDIKKFLGDWEVTEGEIPLWGAKIKVGRLKEDPTARQKVRDALEPQLSTMLKEIETVFDNARLQVREYLDNHLSDIVVILDNLEKIERFAKKEAGMDSQRELFLERYTQLTSMNAHFIYTVPLRLARSQYSPQLSQLYGSLPIVLPMINVMDRRTREPSHGTIVLRELLQKRLGDDLLLDEVFDSEALEFLLTYSGGHVRNLIIFVQEACNYAEDIPIPLNAARKAVQQTARTYHTSIPEHHWEKLATLDRSPNQEIPNNDEDFLTMLENLSVLEYINGDEEADVAFGSLQWYAVNPIVRELPKFKAAAKRLEEAETNKAPSGEIT